MHGQYNTTLPEVIFESQKVGNNQELEELAVKSPKEITITCYWTQERDFIVNLLPYHCFPYSQSVT